MLDREIEDLETKVGGVQEMDQVPEAVFIVDIRSEKTALQEARRTGATIIAMCDTNVNPEKVDYVIPANDDAVKSIEMITALVAEAIKEGALEAPKKEDSKSTSLKSTIKRKSTTAAATTVKADVVAVKGEK